MLGIRSKFIWSSKFRLHSQYFGTFCILRFQFQLKVLNFVIRISWFTIVICGFILIFLKSSSIIALNKRVHNLNEKNREQTELTLMQKKNQAHGLYVAGAGKAKL